MHWLAGNRVASPSAGLSAVLPIFIVAACGSPAHGIHVRSCNAMRSPSSVQVVVEAGTPRGFEIVLEAREALLIREDKVKTDISSHRWDITESGNSLLHIALQLSSRHATQLPCSTWPSVS